MTEGEWLACTEPGPMLGFLRERASVRKLGLLACACCRRVWHLLADPRSREAVEVAERYADGRAPWQELYAANWSAKAAEEAAPHGAAAGAARCAVCTLWAQDTRPLRSAATERWTPNATAEARGAAADACAAVSAAALEGSEEVGGDWRGVEAPDPAWSQEAAHQGDLARDLFGNPFRPISIDPTLLTPAVVSLAEAAYDHRFLPSGHLDPVRLGVLADALEDAGCMDPDILGHLRGPGPHVRGCWVLDLLLSKE